MLFFSRKQKVGLEGFCREFYENNILSPVIGGVDAGTVFYDASRHSIIEVDSSFAKIDSGKFVDEMTILRFELFALAWSHKFGSELSVTQSIFTKYYLREKKRDDIWNNSESYNQAIARSSMYGLDPTTPMGKSILVTHNTTLANLFDKYHKQGFDSDCIARAVNRESTDIVWKSGNTAKLLTCTLCDRLGLKSNEPSIEAQFRITAIINGLYDGAHQVLDKIKLKTK